MTPKSARTLAYQELLVSIVDFMFLAGIREKEIHTTVTTAMKSAEKRSLVTRKANTGIASAALVLDAWHRNRRYITKDAEPIPVPLLGPSPSVEALARVEHGRRGAAAFARYMKSVKLVVPCGRHLYRPANRAALVATLDPYVIQHLVRSLSMLLATIHHNTKQNDGADRFIERFAEVPDLPVQYLADFRKFTQTQGWAFLKTVNDWLESRRARRSSGPRLRKVSAGVHVHAYASGVETKRRGATVRA